MVPVSLVVRSRVMQGMRAGGGLRGGGRLLCLVYRRCGRCTRLGRRWLVVCCSPRCGLLVLPLVSPSLAFGCGGAVRGRVKRRVGGSGRGMAEGEQRQRNTQ